MIKGNSLSVLLIAVFLAIFVPSIQAGPLSPVASAAPGFHGATNNMLQFKAGGHLLGFQPGKVYLASLDHALSVEFLGTPGVTPKTVASGGETGKESKVPTLGRVVYEELWEGITLTYEARERGIAESTYHVRPWADVSKIRLGYNVPVEVQEDGSLRFKFDRGFLTESSPEAWQEIGGKRVPVEVAFRVKGGEVGFSVGPYDPNYPLTIDPTYAWHTFYGSTGIDGFDLGYAIVTDGSGNLYVTGESYPWNGPAGQIPLHAHSGGVDVFVLKLNSAGAYQWHTFYGSSGVDWGNITIDGSGNIYIAGASDAAWNGPAGQIPLHAHSGGEDIFVLKLSSSGAYQWHTFYGTSNDEGGDGIAMDGSGNIYVTGESSAAWLGPAGQIPLHAHSGNVDVFVLKLNSFGSYQWHAFYGSGGNDWGNGLAADGGGNIYVTGESNAAWNGPTGQIPLHAYSAAYDIFLLKLDSSGAYQWHTFYGSGGQDDSYAVATDGSGNIYLTGESSAAWLGPAGQSPLREYTLDYDIFVLKLNGSGAYQWHTFYGTNDSDSGFAIATDGSGNIYVTGESNWSIFVLKLTSSGARQWHTFYGAGGAYDYGTGIATDGRRNVYVTGRADATWNGPAGQNPLNAFSGGSDIFALKLSGTPISCDFDGDGKTDIAVYRGSTGAWYVNPSGGGAPYGVGWGISTDKPVPGDYDGDGKTDIAVYRGSTGVWYGIPSSGAASYGFGWGGDPTDKPIPGDYDGDGKIDRAVYRTGTGIWYVYPSSGAVPYGVGWGGNAADKPVPADYDGDGKADCAVYRDGVWFIYPSGDGSAYAVGWGTSGDKPAPGDYDGDGKTDCAVYRDGLWFVYPSGGASPYAVGWGTSGDKPAPGDYSGDGKTDIAVYRPSTGVWYIIPSGGGSPYGVGWGGDPSDIPVTTNPGSY